MASKIDLIVKEIGNLLKKVDNEKDVARIEALVDELEIAKLKGEIKGGNVLVDKLDDILNAISSSDSITKDDMSGVISSIEKIKIDVPAPKVSVSTPKIEMPEINIPEAKLPVINFPKLPDFSKLINSIIVAIKGDYLSRSARDPISVRLSDGEKFYRAIGGAMQSLGSILTFKRSDNSASAGLVDDDGVLQVRVRRSELPGGASTSAKQDDIISTIGIKYEYMGDQTSGDYKYLGFKQNGGANWKIMRKDNTDSSAWKYCYGTTGWTTAWSDPTTLTFADPPST